MAAQCSSPSLPSSFMHDIFLSFRGEDVRQTFISHLYKQLCLSGISTFIDDKMERGQVIYSALVTAIENSMCSIVVLSENYASSRCCLEELVKILECKREQGQRVIPIFYNIDPSDVQNQRGKIGKAMAKHERNLKEKMEGLQISRDALTKAANLYGWDSSNQEKIEEAMAKQERNLKENMERVQIWRDALTEVANLSGWDSRNHKNEAMLIEDIIQIILEGMHKDGRKSVDGGMPAISTRAYMQSGKAITGDLIRSDKMRNLTEFIGPVDDAAARDLIQLTRETKAVVRDLIQLTRGMKAVMRDLIQLTPETKAVVRDLIQLTHKMTAVVNLIQVTPQTKAFVRELIQVTREMIQLTREIIQSTCETEAVVRYLIQKTRKTEALTHSPLPIDGSIIWRLIPFEDVAPSPVDKKFFRSRTEEVRSISSDHVGKDSKGQGKLSTISGCKNLSIKFRTSIKARLLGLTWSTTIKARLRAEQVLIVLHYVKDSIVSSYTNASILILVVGSWNLLYVLFLQSCEDVFHGSPATIFCELKLSDLRSCEVGCFGNPLNWGDGVVRGIISAEVEGEEAGKGKP